jgi:hypothetical protein
MDREENPRWHDLPITSRTNYHLKNTPRSSPRAQRSGEAVRCIAHEMTMWKVELRGVTRDESARYIPFIRICPI